jgi:hypothetical protein
LPLLLLVTLAAGCSSVKRAIPATSSTTPAPVSTIAAVQRETKWTEQIVGSQPGGQVIAFAAAPDGRAVAFLEAQRSGLANRITGFTCGVDSKWTSIPVGQEPLVGGRWAITIMTGPTHVVWFKDRFIAIGRTGKSPQQEAQIATWVSTDGLTWSVVTEKSDWEPIGLTVSIDGSSVVGVWSPDATIDGGRLEFRSSTDGTSWTSKGNHTVKLDSQRFSDPTFSIAPMPKSTASIYVVYEAEGDTGKLFTSTDLKTWKAITLEVPIDEVPMASGEVRPQTIVRSGDGIIAYATMFTYTTNADKIHKTYAWKSTDGKRFSWLPLDNRCDWYGELHSITADPVLEPSTIFAICVGGDTVADPSVDDSPYHYLSQSSDGVTFASDDSSTFCGPKSDVTGPVVIDGDGAVSVFAICEGGSGGVAPALSLWKRSVVR